MVVALLLALSLAPNGKIQTAQDDLPALLIYLKPAFDYPQPPLDICAAVWKDGRIIWRDPQDDRTAKGEKIEGEGAYFEARISPGSVEEAIGRLRKDKVFKYDDWSMCSVDTSTTVAVVRDDNGSARLKYSEHFWSDEDRQSPFFYFLRPQYTTWKSIRSEAVKLAPTTGEKITRPSAATIRSWDRDLSKPNP